MKMGMMVEPGLLMKKVPNLSLKWLRILVAGLLNNKQP